MSMYQNGWLAFELNVLRRLKFSSIAIPLDFEPNLGFYLKRWGITISTNNPLKSSHSKGLALVANNSYTLSEQEVEKVLEDAYVPHYKLHNLALRKWFNETDAWWFDNVRQNIERLDSQIAKSIAMTIAMQVGDYTLSFSEETLPLRQPLSKVFKRLWLRHPAPVNNGKENSCQNKNPIDYLVEHKKELNFVPELMFLKLPPIRHVELSKSLEWKAWREEWIRKTDDFWHELDSIYQNTPMAKVETKSQYLKLIKSFLETALHIEKWAISHVEDGSIPTQELVETVESVRKVKSIYTKDFSEFTRRKAVIITA